MFSFSVSWLLFLPTLHVSQDELENILRERDETIRALQSKSDALTQEVVTRALSEKDSALARLADLQASHSSLQQDHSVIKTDFITLQSTYEVQQRVLNEHLRSMKDSQVRKELFIQWGGVINGLCIHDIVQNCIIKQ